MDKSTGIDRFLQSVVDNNGIPGLVAAVAGKDRIRYFSACGKMDIAHGVAMQMDTIFSIASMTKLITSTAVMMQYEANKIALDDPISVYFPALKDRSILTHLNEANGTFSTRPASIEITVRHLLTHTSGFGYGFSNHSLNKLIQLTGKGALDLPLLHEPGSRWTYGISTQILGKLVEEVSGMHLDDFFKARIFDPLGMNDTFYRIPQAKLCRRATIYQREDGILLEQPKPEVQQPTVLGDGFLFSTAMDYIAFLQLFLNEGTFRGSRILNKKSIDLMMQNQIDELVVEEQPGADPMVSNAFPLGAGKDKFGFGFQISVGNEVEPNRRSPGSCSWSGIYNTHFWVDPLQEIVAVILMQVLPFYDEACIRAYQGFERLVYEHLN